MTGRKTALGKRPMFDALDAENDMRIKLYIALWVVAMIGSLAWLFWGAA